MKVEKGKSLKLIRPESVKRDIDDYKNRMTSPITIVPTGKKEVEKSDKS